MIVADTIVAQASAQGNAARGIVRLSGNESLNAVLSFFSPNELQDLSQPSKNGVMHSTDVNKPWSVSGWFKPWGNASPFRQVKGFLFYWPAGHGFTGEQAIELHLPSSPPILNASIRTLCAMGKVRLAERGEFTLRAFLNGRLDLTQAEAILGTIDATSDDELKNALKQLSGTLSRQFYDLRSRLLDVLSELEAGFDFIDEDIEFVSFSQTQKNIEQALEEVDQTLQKASTQLSQERSPRVVLTGRPNVGKSSLFNALVAKFHGKTVGKALVSGVAGTTRDYLEADLLINGASFTLVDSAGLEKDILSGTWNANKTYTPKTNAPSTLSPRELAQHSLRKTLGNPSLVVCCFDTTNSQLELEEELKGFPVYAKLNVLTKQDLVSSIPLHDRQRAVASPLETSATTNIGIEELGMQIVASLRADTENGEIVTSTALRCQEALRNAKASLQNALDLLENETFRDESLVASELRLALNQIGLITGQIHTDDLLDRIFSRFCIGK